MANSGGADDASSPPHNETAAGAQQDAKLLDLDLDFDDDDEKNYKTWIAENIWPAFRSACLIHLIDSGLPETQRWMFYLLHIHFHEDLHPPFYLYSLLPISMMWYFPWISPIYVHTILRSIDSIIRSDHKSNADLLAMSVPTVVYSLSSAFLSLYISFRGMTEVFESLFGPANTWPAALLPVIPGMYFRSSEERPCSINGFVPEDKQGILMAVFTRASAAVLPGYCQWALWAAYAGPSRDYPVMLFEWAVATLSWIFTGTRTQASYAIYLLVNQYRHPYIWFRDHSGGPSVILLRERRGTMWFIITNVVISIIDNWAGPSIVESGSLDLSVQIWIPLVLILMIGIYLLRYGLAMRIYKFKHQPLERKESIRILRLRAQPCLPNAPTQCEIIHTTLQDPPPYVAISHRWADPEELILIDGGLFPVSRNIYTLLIAKRSNLHHRLFWIDSICINQDDVAEKSRQVGMMRRIFEEAELTLGWLGDDPGAAKAFNLVGRINKISSESDYTSLRSEADAGWTELRKMVTNAWFERVWIIQEIAVAKAQILRYGNQEVSWGQFARAMRFVLFFDFRSGEPNEFAESNELLSALVMDDIRASVEDVDYLQLKDTLKLALRFHATLPIDKVYAMLGIVDEQYTPLFHPKFATNNLLDGGSLRPHMAYKDVLVVVGTMSDMIQTATGKSRSRRGRALLSTANNGIRHFKMLMRDLGKLNSKISRMQAGEVDFESESIRPDYSEKTTPQLVYIYVARDHIRQGDIFSFIGLAGIGFNQGDNRMTGLPSWVPDWSTNIGVYVLPQFPSLTVEAVDTTVNPESDKLEGPDFRDGGSKFFFIRASVIGKITHTVTLSQDYSGSSQEIRREAVEDFKRLSSSFRSARDLARKHLTTNNQSEDVVDSEFNRTLLAGRSADNEHATFSVLATGILPWTHDMEDCVVPAALWPKGFDDYWSKTSDFDNPEALERRQMKLCKSYLRIRRMQSSSNSKFAHLIRSEVAPSFAKYRQPRGSNPKPKKAVSMLDGANNGAVAGYAQYVDYAIGRKLAILGSGVMGLVPSGAEEGDWVVEIQSKGRSMWLALRKEDFPDQNAENPIKATQAASTSQSQSEKSQGEKSQETHQKVPSDYETFRLVGESYIHYSSSENPIRIVEKRRWFRLW